MRWLVELGHVLADHALAVELRTEMHEGLLHAAHPIDGNALIAVLVIHRHNFIFQDGVDGAGMDLVLILRIRPPGRRWPSRRKSHRPRRTSRPEY